jgi:hypothetical protein
VTYNSDVTGFDMTPDFQHTGTWYNYFTGEPYEVNQTSQTLYYGPGQYYVFTDQPLPIPDTSFVPFPEENPDDISETDRSALKVYPNPTSSSAIIEFELDGENLQSIEVLDLMGRTVDQLNISNSRNAGLNRFKWNADGFENGQYIFKVVTDKQIRSKMIAIQR